MNQPYVNIPSLCVCVRVCLNFIFLTLQYCIGFAIYQNESTTGIPVSPILNPPPSSLPIPSLWVVPMHQPQASSIMHRTWTGDSFHIWISFPFRSAQSTEFPVLYSRFWSVTYFKHSSVYMPISISQFIPPSLSPLGDHTFVLYICIFISALQKDSSVHFLRFFSIHKKYANNFRAYLHHLSGIMSQTKSYCLYKQIHYCFFLDFQCVPN